MEKLEKASENPELIPEMEAEVKAGGKASLLSTDKVRSRFLFPWVELVAPRFRSKQFGQNLVDLISLLESFLSDTTR